MIDVSKIRVGDEVTVRAKVSEHDGGDDAFPIRLDGGTWVHRNDILTHTPAPRAFKPGDRVYEIGFDQGFSVVHVSGELAWVGNGNWNKIARLLHLRHADESE